MEETKQRDEKADRWLGRRKEERGKEGVHGLGREGTLSSLHVQRCIKSEHPHPAAGPGMAHDTTHDPRAGSLQPQMIHEREQRQGTYPWDQQPTRPTSHSAKRQQRVSMCQSIS